MKFVVCFDLFQMDFHLRTEVTGDFNIHGTRIFRMLFSIKNKKKYDVVIPSVPLVGQKTCAIHEILSRLAIT